MADSYSPDAPSQKKDQNRNSKRGAFLALVVVLIVWRGYADRNYWIAPWNQKTHAPANINRQPLDAGSRSKTLSDTPFDLTTTTIPKAEILSGGPPKDGIPALTNPELIPAAEATYLKPTDRVIGLASQEEARAYPLRILNYHEIVNDLHANTPVAVTYCPLCDSCAVFDRRTQQGETEFGVSGLLYNSNVLMYDRAGKTASLWSQLQATAVSGPAATQLLTALPFELTTWQDWQSRHPNTQVLSTNTGHPRDYSRSPYVNYFKTDDLMFPVQPRNDRLPAKARILGIWTEQGARAYPESVFNTNHTELTDTLHGKKHRITYNPATESMQVTTADDGIHWMYSLWFAWYAMHPDTEVYSSNQQ